MSGYELLNQYLEQLLSDLLHVGGDHYEESGRETCKTELGKSGELTHTEYGRQQNFA